MSEKSIKMTRVVGPDVSTEDPISGQITVSIAGTAVAGPDVALTNGAWVMAHPSNAGLVAYGNDGNDDVTMNNGIVLDKGKMGPPLQVANLNQIYFDSANNGDKFCWIKA